VTGWARRWGRILLWVTPLVVFGCRGESSRYPGAPLILISIDTLRSDHVPAYGYRGVETPALDALARDGIVFERAYSHVPLTLPSHATILSGRLPAETGVRDNVGYHFDAERLDDLPVALRRAGYATGAAVSAFVLRAETGIGSGFDFYDSQVDIHLRSSLGMSQRPGQQTEAALLGWLRGAAKSQKPIFAFLHLYEPHTPYTPPEPFATRYRSSPYDGEIAAADAIVGDFIGELKNLGLYDSAVVILLSDHGEGLGDHGEREHGLLLYRETLQVPLMLKLPHQARGGQRSAAPAGLVDVYPTALALLGRPVPEKLPGRSLLANPSETPREIFSETAYPRLHFGWSELSSLIQDRFHYIHGPDPELYDLTADPGEHRSVLRDERKTFAALRTDIQGFQHAVAAPAASDAETLRQLSALGYAGNAVTVGKNDALPDPKSKISSLDGLFSAMSLFAAQRCTEAVPAFQAALRDNPRMVDGWEHLALCLDQLGQESAALEADKEALKLSGGAAHLAIATGYILLKMGRYDEATAHADLARKESPAQADALLADIALTTHHPEQAERQAQAALSGGMGGLRVGPLITMAEARVKENRLEEALHLLDQADQDLAAHASGQAFPGLSFTRGDVLARMGRNADAEKAFRKEIRDNPNDARAPSSLALLYASEGRPREAVETLQQLTTSNQSPGAYAAAVRTLRVLGDSDDATSLLNAGLRLFPSSPELKDLVAGATPSH
jgi:tetratricopeptide (TPR) repeat protein